VPCYVCEASGEVLCGTLVVSGSGLWGVRAYRNLRIRSSSGFTSPSCRVLWGSGLSYRPISDRSCWADSGGNIDKAARANSSERSREASALSLPTAPT
jgi:hypothetical protein